MWGSAMWKVLQEFEGELKTSGFPEPCESLQGITEAKDHLGDPQAAGGFISETSWVWRFTF